MIPAREKKLWQELCILSDLAEDNGYEDARDFLCKLTGNFPRMQTWVEAYMEKHQVGRMQAAIQYETRFCTPMWDR